MLGSVVAEDVVNPVHSSVNGVTGLVFVNLRQPLGPLAVAAGKNKEEKAKKGKMVVSAVSKASLPTPTQA